MAGLDKNLHRLWVEGHDDLHVISNLMNRRLPIAPFPREEPTTKIIHPSGSFDDALDAFALALKNQKLECAGLVVDKDSEAHGRWDRVREVLQVVRHQLPDVVPPSGLIVESTTKPTRWGIWLMPDNHQFGELEHFVASLAPSLVDLYNHAQASVAIASKMTGAFRSKDELKATLHTYAGQPIRDFQGVLVPESVPVGTYTGVAACEFLGFPPAPGAGGQIPCGSYGITEPTLMAACSAGLDGTTTSGWVNSINEVNIFVEEELRLGNTHFYGNSLRWGQRPRQAFLMKFRTGGAASDFPVVSNLPPGVLGSLGFAFSNQANRGEVASLFVTFSQTPCDFSYQRFDAADPCYKWLFGGGGAVFPQIAPEGVAVEAGRCKLLPNTTYYLNMRWEDPSPATRGRLTCHPTTGSATYPFCGTNLTIN